MILRTGVSRGFDLQYLAFKRSLFFLKKTDKDQTERHYQCTTNLLRDRFHTEATMLVTLLYSFLGPLDEVKILLE
jgi:hypothetical protein